MNYIIDDLNETGKEVYRLLMKYPHLKDSDRRLVATYHCYEVGGKENLSKMSAVEYLDAIIQSRLTNPDTITRARRKVQEEHPEARGEKYLKRKKNESEVREQINQ